MVLALVPVLAPDWRFGFAGAAAAVLMLVQVQVLALDRCFGFAGAAAGLMLVLDRRFVLLVLVLAQAPALDRRFVLSCQGWNRHVMPRMTSD